MIKSDYLLRLIEQFAEALRRVLRRKQDKQYEQAAQELNEFAQGLLGMDLATLAGMGVQALAVVAPEPERLALVARALKEYGEIVELSRDAAAASAFYKQAFLLYDALEQRGDLPGQGDHAATLQWLLGKLG